MDIISINYLLFVLGVLIVYQSLPPKAKKFWILLASLTFYGSISFTLFLTLIFSIFFNFWITFSRLKYKTWIAVIINILILFSFKFEDSSFLLPIGVSFFTFQGLSFVFDYSKKQKIQLIDFANYMSFFPQLIAGPIESFNHLGAQMNNLAPIQKKNVFSGMSLMLKGLVFKFVIANRCGLIVSSFYDEITSYDGWFLLFANLLFTFQILFDFSGYCFIAMGIAKILGISLSKNFTSPYRSTSLSDFWKKWHTTLHKWFKSYVFIPIVSYYPFWVAAVIVFFLSSIWHGIETHFLIWGLICLLFLFFDKYLIQKIKLPKLVKWIITFSMIYLSWIPFRVSKSGDITNILKLNFKLDNLIQFLADHTYVLKQDFMNNLSSICQYNNTSLNITYFDFYILTVGILMWCLFSKKINRLNPFYKSIFLFLVLGLLGYDNSTPFIYFQF
ncbi:MAG: hypothetical protein CMP67_09135 [Flavobacteriales bacterium]|nr:hypothetical protein [Flavobacteriales bacterium]|tara:strand:+ start:423 stop:1754 length:1332 start_codon:yes stop_codon:yes gene_type:complete